MQNNTNTPNTTYLLDTWLWVTFNCCIGKYRYNTYWVQLGGGQVHSFFLEIWGFQQSCFLIRFLFSMFNCFLVCGMLLCFFILVLRLLLQFVFSTSIAPPQTETQYRVSSVLLQHSHLFRFSTSGQLFRFLSLVFRISLPLSFCTVYFLLPPMYLCSAYSFYSHYYFHFLGSSVLFLLVFHGFSYLLCLYVYVVCLLCFIFLIYVTCSSFVHV